MAWWAWVLIGWPVLAVVVAVPLGLAMGEADRRERAHLGLPVAPARPRRRHIPLPAVSVVLAGVGTTLEAIGFVLRVHGADRTGTGRLLSMDLPLSVPRMYVAAVFAAAALAAFAGAYRLAGRRTWWLAVGSVAAVITEVKAGGTVHVRVLAATGLADRPALATVASGAVVAVVLAGLWWLSRTERRDRRRVLGAFALYGLAAGGLSGLSAAAGQAFGGTSLWTTVATFVEESGEVVGGVAVLTAVLVGVAPRVVLPADWALRRRADAETVDAPALLPGRLVDGER